MTEAFNNQGVEAFFCSFWERKSYLSLPIKFLDFWWSRRYSCAQRPWFDNGPFFITAASTINKGLVLNRSYIVVWNGTKIEVYQLRDNIVSQVSSFDSNRSSLSSFVFSRPNLSACCLAA